MNSDYFNPVKIIDSENWFESWQTIRRELGINKPLVITFKENVRRLELDKICNPAGMFTEVVNNPTFTSCQEAIDFSRSDSFDCVIAFGGGSVMDTAKAVMASLGTGLINLKDLLDFKQPFPHRIPAIFIPTTHGTSSEVTMWATIWNRQDKKKYSLMHPELYPDIAILDGSLTLSLPPTISLSTTLDALSHSFEAIWNKNANPQSTQYAIQAIGMLLENVEGLKQDFGDIQIRRKLLKASNIAGLAFSNTKTAAAHSISYPLTSLYNIPHGIAASMPLLPLITINQNAIEDQLCQIRINLNLKNNSALKDLIAEIPGDLIKFNLRDWGIKLEQISELIDLSFTKGRMDNNIIDLTKDDVSGILHEMYS